MVIRASAVSLVFSEMFSVVLFANISFVSLSPWELFGLGGRFCLSFVELAAGVLPTRDAAYGVIPALDRPVGYGPCSFYNVVGSKTVRSLWLSAFVPFVVTPFGKWWCLRVLPWTQTVMSTSPPPTDVLA